MKKIKKKYNVDAVKKYNALMRFGSPSELVSHSRFFTVP